MVFLLLVKSSKKREHHLSTKVYERGEPMAEFGKKEKKKEAIR
jgi:hypothetical protein